MQGIVPLAVVRIRVCSIIEQKGNHLDMTSSSRPMQGRCKQGTSNQIHCRSFLWSNVWLEFDVSKDIDMK